MGKLDGKVAVVTGASSGLGYEIVKSFMDEGAFVIGAARHVDKLKELQKQSPNFYTYCIDVASGRDVAFKTELLLKNFGKVDILVNNAGITGSIGNVGEDSLEEWEDAIRTNLLGSVYMCHYLVPQMKRNKKGKIIQLSGGGATSPMPTMSAYSASKAGVVRFAETLAMEVKDFGIDVNSVAPGMMATHLLDNIFSHKDKVDKNQYDKILNFKNSFHDSFKEAVELILFLASEESNGITGKLISAQWDNWKEFPKHIGELKNSDVYTLRRIIEKDRGMLWGDK